MLPNCSIQSPLVSTVLDCCIGRLYAMSISDSALLKFLQNSKRDSERLAALHCALLCVRSTTDLEMKVGKEFLLSSFSDWSSHTEPGQGYDVSERRKILIHMYLLLVPRGLSPRLPKVLYWSKLTWKHLSLYHDFMQNVSDETKVSVVRFKFLKWFNREMWKFPLFSFWQIIWWISENLSTCHSFDPIQEFIIGKVFLFLHINFSCIA